MVLVSYGASATRRRATAVEAVVFIDSDPDCQRETVEAVVFFDSDPDCQRERRPPRPPFVGEVADAP